jgi:hypothetical protein
MANVKLILLVFAFVTAALAAAGVPSGRYNLIGAALAFLIAATLFG